MMSFDVYYNVRICIIMYEHVAPLSLYDVHLCMLVIIVSSVQKSS